MHARSRNCHRWRRRAIAAPLLAAAAVLLLPILHCHAADGDLARQLPGEPLLLSGTTLESVLQTIDGRDIACRTARNWLPSDVLRARAKTLVQMYCKEDECTRRGAQSLANFLHMQAAHQEDIGAASALRAYYTRIALAEQLSLTQTSLDLVNREASKQDAIQDAGLAAGTDLSSFERLQIEILDTQLQVQSKDRQLRSLLCALADVDYEMHNVRQERLEIFECPIDCLSLQQTAMSLRQDLRGWNYLAGQVNEESAPMFAKMLTSMVGGWGLPIPTIASLKMLLCPPDYSGLASNLQHEIRLTAETHRRWICQAVEEKCNLLILAYQRIDLARQTVDSWQTRLQQLQELDKAGNGRAEASAETRSALVKARKEEIARRLDAKLAEIDLAEACGGLSLRCCQGLPWLLTGHE